MLFRSRAGGTVIYSDRPRGLPATVEGDGSMAQRWQAGDTGRGRAICFAGDPVPGEHYARFVREEVARLGGLRPEYRRALRMRKPASVYWSVLENGFVALLNFSDEEAEVEGVVLKPYAIAFIRPPVGTP